MSTWRGAVLLCYLVLLQQTCAVSVTVASQSCATGTYYSISSFACVACDSTQDVSEDGFGCVCKAGYIRDFSTTSTSAASPPCTACSEASSSDRLFCMTCDGTTTGFDSSTKECGCASNQGLVETDTAGSYRSYKSCTACTAGSYLVNGVCTACPDSRMTATVGSCTCTTEYVQVNSVCLHQETAEALQSSYPSASAYSIGYADVVGAAGSFTSTLTSATLSEWFYEAGVKCKRQAGVEWCQMLANMCVLNMYLLTHPSCQLFNSLTSSSTLNGFSGWGSGVGFLYYDGTTVLSDTSLAKEYTFQDASGSTITMTLASYAFNGTFLGWRTLGTQLALCGGEYEDLMRWSSFGTWKRFKCDIDINRVFRSNDTVFYDPYYIDSDGKYYPMPVQVENYRDASGNAPNHYAGDYYYQETFDSSAVLTRRFFVVDNLSGRTSSYFSAPDVVRVIERAGLLMHIRNPSNPGKIYPPRLVIRYHEVDVKGLDATMPYEIETQFGIAYAMETSETFGDAFIAYFAVCVTFAVPLFGLRCFRILRGNQGQSIDGSFVQSIVGALFRTIGHTFGVAYILLAFYFYIAFKMQGSVTLLIPNDSQIANDMYLYWSISFVGVFCGTLFVLFDQINADVFFIDWEATPGRVHSSNSSTSQVAVSAWRSLFVANEFARLQTQRILNFDLTCVWVLFFLAGVPSWNAPYYNASCNTPDGSLLEDCSEWGRSGLLRVAVDAFFWCVVATWQVLFNKFLYQQYYKHPSLQLLDAMSLANISAWILRHKYTGYYLHGQSPLQHADTTLADFTELLANEESELTSTSKRGLATGSDCQEYLMFINPNTRLKYDAFLEHIKESKMLENESLTFVGQLKQEFVGHRDRLLKPGSNSMLDGQKAVNSLLKNFVKLMQTTYKDTHIIEPTFVQRMLEIPPSEDETPHATLWTDDTHHTWTSVLFEGIEFDLILFDIYVFTLFDLLAKQPVIALLCTFLLQKSINFLRHELGIRNLGEKTLIGDRFFI